MEEMAKNRKETVKVNSFLSFKNHKKGQKREKADLKMAKNREKKRTKVKEYSQK